MVYATYYRAESLSSITVACTAAESNFYCWRETTKYGNLFSCKWIENPIQNTVWMEFISLQILKVIFSYGMIVGNMI